MYANCMHTNLSCYTLWSTQDRWYIRLNPLLPLKRWRSRPVCTGVLCNSLLTVEHNQHMHQLCQFWYRSLGQKLMYFLYTPVVLTNFNLFQARHDIAVSVLKCRKTFRHSSIYAFATLRVNCKLILNSTCLSVSLTIFGCVLPALSRRQWFSP